MKHMADSLFLQQDRSHLDWLRIQHEQTHAACIGSAMSPAHFIFNQIDVEAVSGVYPTRRCYLNCRCALALGNFSWCHAGIQLLMTAEATLG